MLPEYRDEDEDRGDEDEGQGDLGDGAGGEGFYIADGVVFGGFFVPAGEGGEEEEAEEGEDYGDNAGDLVSIDAMIGWEEIWRGLT